jgi:hypothetical protein
LLLQISLIVGLVNLLLQHPVLLKLDKHHLVHAHDLQHIKQGKERLTFCFRAAFSSIMVS